MTQKLSVSIVIPSWNSAGQLQQNMPAVLRAGAAVAAEIIVVDDASTQANALTYLRELGEKITLVVQKKNRGFGATVNHGVRLAHGDIVILLNTDVAPEPECFVRARAYFHDPKLAAIGFNSGEAWMGGEWKQGFLHHFRAEHGYTYKDGTRASLWASGGQGAFSRKKWVELGGMDPLYAPFYWEDTDLGYRAWKRGWEIHFAPDCRVVHHHEKSTISHNFSSAFITRTAARNQCIFVWKNISDRAFLFEHLRYFPLFCYHFPLAALGALMRLPWILANRKQEKRYWKRQDQDILELWKQS